MKSIPFAYIVLLAPLLFIVGCSSTGTYPKLGEIKYDLNKDQTYIIDDWYRQEGAPMAKLGFWGRIIKEGGRVKFQSVDLLSSSFKIDRYPMRISQTNHEEFKKLVVNVKNITPTYGDVEAIKNEEYDLLVLAPSALTELEDRLKELFAQADSQLPDRIKSENFRFVSKIVVVMPHEIAEALFSDITGDIDWNLSDSVAKIEFKDKTKKNVSLNLRNGQIIAYQLSRICWKDGTIIETVEDRGLGIDNCQPFQAQHTTEE
jgi:hypothetical protein